jgi:hypothetical protein
MISPSNKTRLMVGTIAVGLFTAIGWSYSHLQDSSAAAAAAEQDVRECHALADQITTLRQKPAMADAEQLGNGDLSHRIEQAANTAGFSNGSVQRIEPQPSRRVDETNYIEVPTSISLQQVTLEQVFTFLHVLSNVPTGADFPASSALKVRDIRLSAPRGDENNNLWTVESTLIYTVYSPRGKEEQTGPSSGAMADRQ